MSDEKEQTKTTTAPLSNNDGDPSHEHTEKNNIPQLTVVGPVDSSSSPTSQHVKETIDKTNNVGEEENVGKRHVQLQLPDEDGNMGSSSALDHSHSKHQRKSTSSRRRSSNRSFKNRNIHLSEASSPLNFNGDASSGFTGFYGMHSRSGSVFSTGTQDQTVTSSSEWLAKRMKKRNASVNNSSGSVHSGDSGGGNGGGATSSAPLDAGIDPALMIEGGSFSVNSDVETAMMLMGHADDDDDDDNDSVSSRGSVSMSTSTVFDENDEHQVALRRARKKRQQQWWLTKAPKPSRIFHPSLFYNSFMYFTPNFTPRIVIYNIVKRSALFEALIILLVLANSIILVFDNDQEDGATRPSYAFPLEVFFAVVFSIEMLMKMFAFGLVRHRGAYLRDQWNVLDFMIVILSYLVFVPGFGNFTVLRTLRVIRPLRSVNAIPGLKLLLAAIIKSFGKLVHVLFLSLLVVVIFGIFAVQIWGGLFRNRCVEYVMQDSAHVQLDESMLLNVTSAASSLAPLPEDLRDQWRSLVTHATLLLSALAVSSTSHNSTLNVNVSETQLLGALVAPNAIEVEVASQGDASLFRNFTSLRSATSAFATKYVAEFMERKVYTAMFCAHDGAETDDVYALKTATFPEDFVFDGDQANNSSTPEGAKLATLLSQFVRAVSAHLPRRPSYADRSSIVTLGAFGSTCPAKTFCEKASNPGFSYLSFDNLLAAFIVVMQVATFEAWIEPMYISFHTFSILIGFLFFFFLILFGGYFVPNLALAVITEAFSHSEQLQLQRDQALKAYLAEEEKQVAAEQKEQKKRKQQKQQSTDGSTSNFVFGEPTGEKTGNVSPSLSAELSPAVTPRHSTTKPSTTFNKHEKQQQTTRKKKKRRLKIKKPLKDRVFQYFNELLPSFEVPQYIVKMQEAAQKEEQLEKEYEEAIVAAAAQQQKQEEHGVKDDSQGTTSSRDNNNNSDEDEDKEDFPSSEEATEVVVEQPQKKGRHHHSSSRSPSPPQNLPPPPPPPVDRPTILGATSQFETSIGFKILRARDVLHKVILNIPLFDFSIAKANLKALKTEEIRYRRECKIARALEKKRRRATLRHLRGGDGDSIVSGPTVSAHHSFSSANHHQVPAPDVVSNDGNGICSDKGSVLNGEETAAFVAQENNANPMENVVVVAVRGKEEDNGESKPEDQGHASKEAPDLAQTRQNFGSDDDDGDDDAALAATAVFVQQHQQQQTSHDDKEVKEGSVMSKSNSQHTSPERTPPQSGHKLNSMSNKHSSRVSLFANLADQYPNGLAKFGNGENGGVADDDDLARRPSEFKANINIISTQGRGGLFANEDDAGSPTTATNGATASSRRTTRMQSIMSKESFQFDDLDLDEDTDEDDDAKEELFCGDEAYGEGYVDEDPEKKREREEREAMLNREHYEEYYLINHTLRPYRHRYFVGFIVVAILINTMILASRHHEEPDWLIEFSEIANLVFVAIFAVEFALTLFAVGVIHYFTDPFFLLDAVIVVLSIVELSLLGTAKFSVLRALRLLRVLKLLKSVPSLRLVIRSILGALSHTVYLTMIMLLLLFIAALMGMQLFHGIGDDIETRVYFPASEAPSLLLDSNSTTTLNQSSMLSATATNIIVASRNPYIVRSHFDSFLQAFYTVFQVVTRDGWVTVMFNTMASQDNQDYVVLVGAFFIVLVIIGHFVVLSLFLAILILSFEVNDSTHEDDRFGEDLERLLEKDEDIDEMAREAEAEAEAEVLVGSFYGLKLANGRLGGRHGGWICRGSKSGSVSRASSLSVRSNTTADDDDDTSTSQRHNAIAVVVSDEDEDHQDIFDDSHQHQQRADSHLNVSQINARKTSSIIKNPLAHPPHEAGEDGEPLTHRKKKTTFALPPALDGVTNGSFSDVPMLADEPHDDSDDDHHHHKESPSRSQKLMEKRAEKAAKFMKYPLKKQLLEVGKGHFAQDTYRNTQRLSLYEGLSSPTHERRTLRNTLCKVCKSEIDELLPNPPLARARRALAFHYSRGRCARSAVRVARRKLLSELRDYCGVMAHFSSLHATPLQRKNALGAQLTYGKLRDIADLLGGDDVHINLDFLFDLNEKVVEIDDRKYEMMSRQNTEDEEQLGTDAVAQTEAKIQAIVNASETKDWEKDCAEQRALWTELQEELEVKRVVIVNGLRNGNDQIGGAALGVGTASFPKVHVTNGGFVLGLLGPMNPFRIAVSQIVSHPGFDYVSAFLIFVSTVLLAFDNPRNDQSTTSAKALEICNFVFTGIFVVEIVMRILAKGLFFNAKTAFLGDGWGRLDAFVVVISVVVVFISVFSPESETGSEVTALLRSMKALRALRPLRLVARNRGLKMVVATLIKSIRGIFDVTIVCALFFVVAGILSMELFSGKMYRCTDPSVTSRNDCVGMFMDDLGGQHERRWVNSMQHFDHIGAAMLSLFEVSAGKWIAILYRSMDAKGVNDAPERDYNVPSGLFLVVFFILSNFFMVNMFIAIVVYNFHRVKNRVDGLSLLTDEQRLWVETQRLMIGFRPAIKLLPPSEVSKLRKGASLQITNRFKDTYTSSASEFHWMPYRNNPKQKKRQLEEVERHQHQNIFQTLLAHIGHFISGIRDSVFHFVTSSTFEVFIAGAIIANITVLMMYHYGQDSNWDLALNITNDFFVWLFVLEMLLKIFGLGFGQYFSINRNRFDAFIAIISVIDFALEVSGSFTFRINFTVLRVFRVFRILRVLRLVRQASHLRTLIETIYFALPSLINIYIFMLLIFFIYAIAGVQLFSKIDEPISKTQAQIPSLHDYAYVGSSASGDFTGIDNAYQNFHNFGNAFLLLFSFTTGEVWNQVMHDCMLKYPQCGFLEKRNVTRFMHVPLNTTGVHNATLLGVDDALGFNVTGYKLVKQIVEEEFVNDDNCGVSFAPLFFVSFMVISSFVVSNLFVEIILDNFSTTLRLERHSAMKLFKLHQFVDMWSDLDPTATMVIPTRHFPEVIARVHHEVKDEGRRTQEVSDGNNVEAPTAGFSGQDYIPRPSSFNIELYDTKDGSTSRHPLMEPGSPGESTTEMVPLGTYQHGGTHSNMNSRFGASAFGTVLLESAWKSGQDFSVPRSRSSMSMSMSIGHADLPTTASARYKALLQTPGGGSGGDSTGKSNSITSLSLRAGSSGRGGIALPSSIRLDGPTPDPGVQQGSDSTPRKTTMLLGVEDGDSRRTSLLSIRSGNQPMDSLKTTPNSEAMTLETIGTTTTGGSSENSAPKQEEAEDEKRTLDRHGTLPGSTTSDPQPGFSAKGSVATGGSDDPAYDRKGTQASHVSFSKQDPDALSFGQLPTQESVAFSLPGEESGQFSRGNSMSKDRRVSTDASNGRNNTNITTSSGTPSSNTQTTPRKSPATSLAQHNTIATTGTLGSGSDEAHRRQEEDFKDDLPSLDEDEALSLSFGIGAGGNHNHLGITPLDIVAAGSPRAFLASGGMEDFDPMSPAKTAWKRQIKSAAYYQQHSRAEVIRKAQQYRIPDHVGYIHFVETLIPLARVMMSVQLSEFELREHQEMWRRLFPDLVNLPLVRYHGTPVDISKYFAAQSITAAFRRRQAIRRATDEKRKRELAIQEYLYPPQLIRRGSSSGGGRQVVAAAAAALPAWKNPVEPVTIATEKVQDQQQQPPAAALQPNGATMNTNTTGSSFLSAAPNDNDMVVLSVSEADMIAPRPDDAQRDDEHQEKQQDVSLLHHEPPNESRKSPAFSMMSGSSSVTTTQLDPPPPQQPTNFAEAESSSEDPHHHHGGSHLQSTPFFPDRRSTLAHESSAVAMAVEVEEVGNDEDHT